MTEAETLNPVSSIEELKRLEAKADGTPLAVLDAMTQFAAGAHPKAWLGPRIYAELIGGKVRLTGPDGSVAITPDALLHIEDFLALIGWRVQ